jgi:hypothetical protein
MLEKKVSITDDRFEREKKMGFDDKKTNSRRETKT